MILGDGWSSTPCTDATTGDLIQTVWINHRKVGFDEESDVCDLCTKVSCSFSNRLGRQLKFMWKKLKEAIVRIREDLFPMLF